MLFGKRRKNDAGDDRRRLVLKRQPNADFVGVHRLHFMAHADENRRRRNDVGGVVAHAAHVTHQGAQAENAHRGVGLTPAGEKRRGRLHVDAGAGHRRHQNLTGRETEVHCAAGVRNVVVRERRKKLFRGLGGHGKREVAHVGKVGRRIVLKKRRNVDDVPFFLAVRECGEQLADVAEPFGEVVGGKKTVADGDRGFGRGPVLLVKFGQVV